MKTSNAKAALALALLVILALFALSACKNSDSGSSFSLHPDADGWPDGMQATSAPAGGDSSGVDSQTGGDAVSSLPGQGTSESDGNPAASEDQTLKTFAGVIDDSGMGRIYITSEDGQTIGFAYGDADISALEDTRPGSPVVVTYTGTLTGTDTSTITVVKMETPQG